MRNVLSRTKTAVILLAVAIVLLCFYAYMLARPISYGMGYHVETEYMGMPFEGTIKFNSDGTMLNRNTNNLKEIESRYYYKDGYVFLTLSETDEEYEKEVGEINENFDESISTPYYAAEIDSFRVILNGYDGYTLTYVCTPAIIFAVAVGVFELILIGMTATSIALCRSSKREF